MRTYRVFYWREFLLKFEADRELTKADVLNPGMFSELPTFRAENLEDLFMLLQGENWSPNGEARGLIRSLGLSHTSMSVGDVAMDEEGKFWQCDSIGWTEVRR